MNLSFSLNLLFSLVVHLTNSFTITKINKYIVLFSYNEYSFKVLISVTLQMDITNMYKNIKM